MSAFKITCILLATIVWVGPAMAQEELKPRQPPSREVLTEKQVEASGRISWART